eukprot:INCI2766.1.p1 GENE.INCI2766.1~~INCI2766.1.p1  ORF type:complete len:899 (-),score=139.34 INCI2766.1:1136-3832(-)
MSWRRRQRATNAVPFPSGLAKRREASPAAIRAKVRAERVDSTALVLAVPAAEAVEQRKLLLEDARSDPLLQGETVTRILQFQKDRAAVEANDKARRAKAMKRYDRRWKHLINLHDFLTQPQFTFSKSLLYVFGTNFPKSTAAYARLLGVLSTSLKVPPVQLELWLKPVFQCFDRKGQDACPIRELLLGYRILSTPMVTPRDRLLEAFKVYDTMWTASVSRQDIMRIFLVPSASEAERDEMREQVVAAFGEITKENRGQPIARQFFEMALDANPRLVQVFHRQCWDRLPNKIREKVLAKQIEVSEADFRKHVEQINLRRARALYEPTALRKRFKRWVEFTQDAHRERLAYRHWKLYRKKRGLRRLRNRVENRRAHQARMIVAQAHCRLESIKLGFEDWITFLDYWEERIKRSEDIAHAHFAHVTFKKFFAPWRELWYSNRAYHFHRRWTLRKHFLAMRDRFFEIKAKENQQRYAAEVRAGLLAIEMAQSSEHAELLGMRQAEAEQRAYEAEVRRLKAVEEEEREYQRKIKEAAIRAQGRKKLMKQFNARYENKQEQARLREEKFKHEWDFLMQQTMERNREDSKKWLFNTEDGRVRLELDTKKLMKAWEDCWQGVKSPKLSEWEPKYDPVYGTIFWLNTRTMEKIGSGDKLDKADAQRIAVEQFVAARTEEELNRFYDIRAREKERLASHRAAVMVQNAYRIRKSRKFLRLVAQTVWIKTMDPGTGEYLCYNEVTEEFSGKLEGVQGAKKPFMLGKDGDIEPNLWQVRFHPDNGRLQYYNRKLPWESSFDPPQGYVLCYKCNTDFACRQNIVGVNVSTRQKIKGGKYCRKCYNIDFGRRPYVNFRNWKRYPVVRQQCVFCKEDWATILCYECDGTYCEKCSGLFHSKGQQANHTEMKYF